MARTRTGEIADAPRPGNVSTPSDMSTQGYVRLGEVPGAPSPSNMSTPPLGTQLGGRQNEIPDAPRPA
jgi:hypothetical protein